MNPMPLIAGLCTHPQDYLAVFEPLLLEECCAQLTRGEVRALWSPIFDARRDRPRISSRCVETAATHDSPSEQPYE